MLISAAQIQEFNGVNAFALTRTHARGMPVPVNLERPSVVRTSSVVESLRLVGGAAERLGRIESNLASILEMTREASASQTTDARKYELFGQMRSLSAGIDEVLGQTTFNKKALFDGGAIQIDRGFGGSSLQKMDGANLRTDGSEGLNLARRGEGAEVSFIYDETDTFLNARAGVNGLNLASGWASPLSDGAQELETGIYRLEVVYNGPDSSLILRDSNNSELSRATQVDLSGEGFTEVAFDVGLTINVQKEILLKGFDKYDYERLGPASLYAKVNYDRISTYELASGGEDAPARPASVETMDISAPLSDSNGATWGIASLEPAAIKTGQRELEEGTYRLEIQYRGEESRLYLSDRRGIPVHVMSGLDLTGEGEQTLNLGNGLVINLDKSSFSAEFGNVRSTFTYNRAREASEGFDFAAYESVVQGALETVSQQIETFAAVESELSSLQQLRNGLRSGGDLGLQPTNGNALASVTANQLIGKTLDSSSSALLNIVSQRQANGQISLLSSGAGAGVLNLLSAQGDPATGIFNTITQRYA